MNWGITGIISNKLIWLVVFLLLYTIWLVPGTLGIRYFCLITGTVFGIHQFIKNKNLINLKNYWNILLIFSLFIIVVTHYFYNSNGSELIRSEFTVIWKKVFLGVIFAIGLGLILRTEASSRYKNIFILSLFLPVVIFIAVYFFNIKNMVGHVSALGFIDYFNPFIKTYVSKYQYVFFTMPILGVGFYELMASLENKTNILKPISILIILLSTFYLIEGKNGFLYFFTCLAFFITVAIVKHHTSTKKIFLVSVFTILVLLIGRQHFINEPTWQHLNSDIQIALDTNKYDHWKHSEAAPLQHIDGHTVSNTTYLRIAWLKEGLLLAIKYPLGYGLIQDSFKYLGKKEWQDASLSHTHWGWLDLTLGLGIAGFVITALAVFNAFTKCLKSRNYFAKSGVWVLPLLGFAFLTSEVCEKTSWDMFLFMIAFYSIVSIEDA